MLISVAHCRACWASVAHLNSACCVLLRLTMGDLASKQGQTEADLIGREMLLEMREAAVAAREEQAGGASAPAPDVPSSAAPDGHVEEQVRGAGGALDLTAAAEGTSDGAPLQQEEPPGAADGAGAPVRVDLCAEQPGDAPPVEANGHAGKGSLPCRCVRGAWAHGMPGDGHRHAQQKCIPGPPVSTRSTLSRQV